MGELNIGRMAQHSEIFSHRLFPVYQNGIRIKAEKLSHQQSLFSTRSAAVLSVLCD